MLGRSFRSAFGTSIQTGYVTTSYLDLRVEPDRLDLALERLVAIRVDRERHRHVPPDAVDVRLVHAGGDLQRRQVGRDREELWDVPAGLHGLPHVDHAADNDAVDRRSQRAVYER